MRFAILNLFIVAGYTDSQVRWLIDNLIGQIFLFDCIDFEKSVPLNWLHINLMIDIVLSSWVIVYRF